MTRHGGRRDTSALVDSTRLVRHRGPDDEGFLLWRPGASPTVFAGDDTAPRSRDRHGLAPVPPVYEWSVGLGHRRLSIVDLSPAGHQPMVHEPTGLAVTYNGEIYNYLELRAELEREGHTFKSHTDTEVLLAAWAEWGPACLDKFNGMFAFVLLDPRGGGTVHAVRDRFGVKPLYWAKVGDSLAFASEIKQVRALPSFTPRLDRSTVRDYLASGMLDHTRHTFDEAVQSVLGGERAEIRLDADEPRLEIHRWYQAPQATWQGSPEAAAGRFRELLSDSVRLRLRSDVPVGSCLSGGLDSSSIVCLADRALAEHGAHAGQITVTACYEDRRFDEWRYAEQAVAQAGAAPVRTWPSVDRLRADVDRLLWHMDEPFGSTSQFSQWCVFGAAADADLKVMLDGQGSDEQLAGYSGSTPVDFLAGTIRRGALLTAAREGFAYGRARGSFPPEVLLAMRNVAPALGRLLPARARASARAPRWLRTTAPSRIPARPPRDLAESLRRQTLSTSLPALLRYEDRTSMAWSIEARVPFLDFRLVEFLGLLPDALKLSRTVTKIVLREAMAGIVPPEILARRDKMGFVTPEEVWARSAASDWFRQGVRRTAACLPELFNADELFRATDDVLEARTAFSSLPWRVLCLGRWWSGLTGAHENGRVEVGKARGGA